MFLLSTGTPSLLLSCLHSHFSTFLSSTERTYLYHKIQYDPFTPKSQCSHSPAWLGISWKCCHVVCKALVDQAVLYCHLHDSPLPQTHMATSQTAPVSHNLSRLHAAIWSRSSYLPSKMCTFSPLPHLSHSSSWIQNPGAMWSLAAPSYSVKGSNHWPADFLTPL